MKILKHLIKTVEINGKTYKFYKPLMNVIHYAEWCSQGNKAAADEYLTRFISIISDEFTPKEVLRELTLEHNLLYEKAIRSGFEYDTRSTFYKKDEELPLETPFCDALL